MAYLKQCVLISRQVGQSMSIATAKKRSAYANAAFYQTMGLKAQANRKRAQADAEFNRERERLLNYMEVNGCL